MSFNRSDFKTYQEVMLVGYVGQDPRVFTYDDGNFTVHFRLATKHIEHGAPRGTEEGRVTTWHRVRLYGAAARYAREWVRKGDRVLVKGELSYWRGKGEDGEPDGRMGVEVRCAYLMAMDDARHAEAKKVLSVLEEYHGHPESWTNADG